MNIAIVGLGLIGGSYAKSISKYTKHKVFAISHNKESIERAIDDGAIVSGIDTCDLCKMDMTIVCLPPKKTIEFLKDNVASFKDGAIVSDICGVKVDILNSVNQLYTHNRVNYVSMHPMAGRECSGYINSLSDLFFGRSLIIIDDSTGNEQSKIVIETLSREIGFANIMHTDSTCHDRIIAYTSQMCHITSNAFVKSPTSKLHNGYSGGSFEDLTRVAFLDPKIWIELFTMNREPLINELNLYIEELKKYQSALINRDDTKLFDLLKEGRDIKESISIK